jgi:homoserine O-acetyltransferase
MLRRSLLVLALGAATIAEARAQAPSSGVVERDFVIRDFRFVDGSVLPELTLHYRTLGRPRRDAAGVVRNAVLVLHGTTGSGAQFLGRPFAGELYGPGQPLDTSLYYVVLPDGIGHGLSSRPSGGMRARFPRYTYDDMVDAQHRLLVDGLGVTHLRLVMGTSMGGMHSWVWGERYPAFMDGIVPLASVPMAIVGRNRMLRRMAMDDIRTDPEWKGGDYVAQPRGLRAALQVLWLMTSAPLVQHRDAPTRQTADSAITAWLDARARAMDANDMLYAFDASRDYDPEPMLGRITAPVLAINSADDLVNPPELGLMERLMPRVARGRYVLLPITPHTRGHGTHTIAAVWKEPFAAFLATLPPLPQLR